MKKKITVDEVRNAYKKTGITPIQQDYCDSYNCMTCPLGVLYFNSHKQALASFKKVSAVRDSWSAFDKGFRGRSFEDLVITWANKTYGKEYADGFINGVDNYKNSQIESENKDNKDFNQGLREGRDVLKSLFRSE